MRGSLRIPVPARSSRCVLCGAWPARPVCDACLAQLAHPTPRCLRCALPLPAGGTCGACLRQPPPLDACLAALPYAWPWSALVARLKFRGEPAWAGQLADLLRATPGVPEALTRADLVLPLPLAPARLAARGFNQAQELARRLAPGRTDAHLLLRVRETPSQTALERRGRERNVQDAFALDPLRRHLLQGRQVLLVDDVMTSGATLHAAARVVRAGGAAGVMALVVARTDAPPP